MKTNADKEYVFCRFPNITWKNQQKLSDKTVETFLKKGSKHVFTIGVIFPRGLLSMDFQDRNMIRMQSLWILKYKIWYDRSLHGKDKNKTIYKSTLSHVIYQHIVCHGLYMYSISHLYLVTWKNNRIYTG